MSKVIVIKAGRVGQELTVSQAVAALKGEAYSVEVQLQDMEQERPDIFGYDVTVYAPDKAAFTDGYFTKPATVSMGSIGSDTVEMYRWRAALIEKACVIAELVNEDIRVISREVDHAAYRNHRTLVTSEHYMHDTSVDDCDECAQVRRLVAQAEQEAKEARRKTAQASIAKLHRQTRKLESSMYSGADMSQDARSAMWTQIGKLDAIVTCTQTQYRRGRGYQVHQMNSDDVCTACGKTGAWISESFAHQLANVDASTGVAQS